MGDFLFCDLLLISIFYNMYYFVVNKIQNICKMQKCFSINEKNWESDKMSEDKIRDNVMG